MKFLQVATGKYNNCTTILCTTSLIRGIASKLGRVLGPRGLMPSERRGTVTDDIEGYLSKLSGTTEWRGDKSGTIRMPIAKVCSFSSPFTRKPSCQTDALSDRGCGEECHVVCHERETCHWEPEGRRKRYRQQGRERKEEEGKCQTR